MRLVGGLLPARDESAVIAPMLHATLPRFGAGDCRLMVGHDPATAAAVHSVGDSRAVPVCVPHDWPTTKADCLHALFARLAGRGADAGERALAVALHD